MTAEEAQCLDIVGFNNVLYEQFMLEREEDRDKAENDFLREYEDMMEVSE